MTVMIKESVFYSAVGEITQRFFILYSSTYLHFIEEAQELLNRCHEQIRGEVPLILRFHLSDIANQEQCLMALLEKFDWRSHVTMIGQAPLGEAKIAVEGWCFSKRSELHPFYFYPSTPCGEEGSFAQMASEFQALERWIGAHGTIAENVVRTWIYCRDIDNNYHGLVVARRQYFDRIGLTANSHYIASTGIEGQSAESGRLVKMDSLAVFGLKKGQIEFMHAPNHMSPTHIYGVTFERGTRLIFGDSSLYFISGTASIDKKGEVVHSGDVIGQAKRMVENVEALLNNHEGSIKDLQQAVVYLRDIADYQRVKSYLENAIGRICPLLIVLAPVCRPGWLIEMECIAANHIGDKSYPIF